MIIIQRGAEPADLAGIRAAELARLQAIVLLRRPTQEDIGDKYAIVKQVLWERQYYKCCYCESVIQPEFSDVEHFRPKTRAVRGPGFPEHGYWWLAWTWENLFFVCSPCNRKSKRDKFPLDPRCTILPVGQPPPGPEVALLIDPAWENPVDHIQFRLVTIPGKQRWIPVARHGSLKGIRTIQDLQLGRSSLLGLYTRHVDVNVRPAVERVLEAGSGGVAQVHREWKHATEQLLAPSMPYVGLSYDALHELVPEEFRTRWGLVIPKPT